MWFLLLPALSVQCVADLVPEPLAGVELLLATQPSHPPTPIGMRGGAQLDGSVAEIL